MSEFTDELIAEWAYADYVQQQAELFWSGKYNSRRNDKMTTVEATNVTTGQVRLSFVHLFQPYANQQGQEPKFSTTILIPKSDMATMQRIQAAIQAAIAKGVAGVWAGTRPAQPRTPIHDGDGVRPNGEAFGPECKGHWVLTASSKQQQAIVDVNMNPIIDQTQVYSGVYGRVNINFFPYSNSGNKGIGAGLGPVQITAAGEPLGGRVTAEQAFGNTGPVEYGQPAPQQGYGQPQAPAYPPQPNYPPPAPQQHQQPPAPGYGQPAPQQYQQPPAPGYGQPASQSQIDPLTGKPIGSVFGI